MNKLKIFFFSFTVLLGSHSTFASSKNKKCLVESINYNIPSLNPHEMKDFTTMRIFDDIFEGLVTYNQQGDIILGCAE